MKRVAVIIGVFVLVTVGALSASGAGGSAAASKYWVELDNAFGLIAGGDLKIAGVRAGKITELKLDRKTKHALVGFSVTNKGFDSLRTDTTCETRPQSLIGEYFVDCNPGTAPGRLADGAVIHIDHTQTTVAPDLVNDILRLPYRERLRLIINELGAGVGGRAQELNDAIRRASPALRETDRVLKILGDQNRVLGDLVKNGDQVIGDLAANRKDVGRWIDQTGRTAAISAERRVQIAQGLHKLPTFLQELRPTMFELGRAADAQTPALVNLRASANQLERFFTQLKPFSDATRVNLQSLGKAARFGREAVRLARPTVAELNRFGAQAPEVTKNLDIILGHLDNRAFAVEPDKRSPGGQGYTGLEALLQWLFDQTLAINIYDQNGYILKVNAFIGKCRAYQNADSAKAQLKSDPNFLKDCLAALGPYQPGLFQPDPTASKTFTRKARRHAKQQDQAAAPTPAGDAPQPKPKVDIPSTIDNLVGSLPNVTKDLPKALPKVGGVGGGGGGGGLPGSGSLPKTGGMGNTGGLRARTADDLLNYLFG